MTSLYQQEQFIRDVFSQLSLSQHNPCACVAPDEWLHADHYQPFTTSNPSTGAALATVDCADHQVYERVLIQAQQAQQQWQSWPAPKRGQLVARLASRIREQQSWLGRLISVECGKILAEGAGEVQEMLDMADFAVGQSRMLYGKTMPSERPRHRLIEQWHPVGVVGVITAFNFPMAVWAWNAMLAWVCGNVVVWKPSPKAALCALAIQKICNEVCLELQAPPVCFLLLEDQPELGERMAHDPRIQLLSFTGSSKVGRSVSQAVAGRFGKVLLELSGNNAVIVEPDANLELALNAVLFGNVGTSGQRCTTTRRLFLHTSIYDEFCQRLRLAYQQVRIGVAYDRETLMGPLIDEEARQHFLSVVSKITALDGDCFYGGKSLNQQGFFVEPTLVQASPHWSWLQEETFGPLLYILPYNRLSDAIAMQNDVAQGLSSALFSNNQRHIELFLSHLGSDCGIANINIGTSGAEIGGAFGGEKETGGGREAGSDAWQSYMRRQTNTINWGEELPLAQGIEFGFDTIKKP